MHGREHLQQRRGRWFIRVRVPADLAASVGQTHIIRSLSTSDEKVARQRRRAALAEIWSWMSAHTVSDGWTPSQAWRTVADGAPDAARTVSFRPRTSRSRQRPSAGPPAKPRSHGQRGVGKVGVDSLVTLMERWLGE